VQHSGGAAAHATSSRRAPPEPRAARDGDRMDDEEGAPSGALRIDEM